jgi:hypothetical protein
VVERPRQARRRHQGGRRLAALLLVGLVLGGLGTGAWRWSTRDADTTDASSTDGAPLVVADEVDGDDPLAVAAQFAALLQRGEDEGERAVSPDAMRPVVCATDMVEIEQAFAELQVAEPTQPSGTYVYSVGTVETTADGGTVAFERRDRGSDEVQTQQATLVREGGRWRVCGLSNASAPE